MLFYLQKSLLEVGKMHVCREISWTVAEIDFCITSQTASKILFARYISSELYHFLISDKKDTSKLCEQSR